MTYLRIRCLIHGHSWLCTPNGWTDPVGIFGTRFQRLIYVCARCGHTEHDLAKP